MTELDDIDRQLIAALQLNGRKSFKEIAEETGIPASSVRYRVQRLEESGTLQIVGIANPLSIGFDRLALIGVRCAPGKARNVCKDMAELTESSYVVLTTGSYDVMVEVVCRDLEHYTELLYDRLQLIDGVVATETFFVLEAHKLAYGWGVGTPSGLTQHHMGIKPGEES